MSEQDKSKKKVDLGNIKTMQDDLDPQSAEDKDLDLELSEELSDKKTSGKNHVSQSKSLSTSRKQESKTDSNKEQANANTSFAKQSQEKSALSGLDFDDEENFAESSEEKQSSFQKNSSKSELKNENSQSKESRLKKTSNSKKEGLDFSQLDDNTPDEALDVKTQSTLPSSQKSPLSFDPDSSSDKEIKEGFSFDDIPSDEDNETHSSSSSSKNTSMMKLFVIGGVCVVLIVGGVGVFFLQSGDLALSIPFLGEEPEDDLVFDNNQSNDNDQSNNNDQSEEKPSIDDIFDDPSPEEPNDENPPNNSLVSAVESLTVTLNQDRNVRTQILEQVNTSSNFVDFKEITLQGEDELPLSFSQFINVFELKIPESLKGNIESYNIYAYNEEGIYKILGSFQLRSNNASFIVDNWKNTLPSDLQAFTLSTSIRLNDKSGMNQGSQTTSDGQVLDSYFYNYNGPSSSIDVLAYTEQEKDYILIGSSQKSFEFFINSI